MRVDVLLPAQFRCIGVHRDQMHPAVAHSGLRDHGFSEGGHCGSLSAQDHGLDAMTVIQMRVHGRHRHVVMLVLHRRQLGGKLALVMIIDIAQRSNAVAGFLLLQARLV